MLDEEIYVLSKHVNFDATYIENLPIYRRRHFLYLFEKESEAIERMRNSYKK